MAVLRAGEEVEAPLRPTVQALRDLDGFVKLMVGGVDAIDDVALALGGEVGVQLDHGGLWCNGVCAIDLDLVVALCVSGSRNTEKRDDEA